MLTPQQLIRGTTLLLVEQALVKETLEQQLAEVGQALAAVTAERDELRRKLDDSDLVITSQADRIVELETKSNDG